jgi:hypothetical protein
MWSCPEGLDRKRYTWSSSACFVADGTRPVNQACLTMPDPERCWARKQAISTLILAIVEPSSLS